MGDLRRVERRGLMGWWKDVSIAMARRVVRRVVVTRATRENGLYVLDSFFDRHLKGLESRTCGGNVAQGKGKERARRQGT